MDVRNDTLYDRFAYPVSKYICRYLPNKQDAEDLLVEVFLAAFNNVELHGLSNTRQLAWLIRVARNKLVDRRRHMALLSMVPIDLVQEFADDIPTPEQHVQQQESYERLNQALKHLSPSQRKLLSLRYISNMNYREIANMLGKSEEAVRQMCSRTLRQLRGIYQQIEGGKSQ